MNNLPTKSTAPVFVAVGLENGTFGVMDTRSWEVLFTRGPKNERIPVEYTSLAAAETVANARNAS